VSNVRLLDLNIPAAGTTTYESGMKVGDASVLLMQAAFENGTGGTTVKAYVQTSLDNGTTWHDVACFAFATTDVPKILHKVTAGATLTAATVPTDGALADNTVKDGILGDQLRTKVVVVGTYTGAHLDVWAEAK
jgi:hypothetical protein